MNVLLNEGSPIVTNETLSTITTSTTLAKLPAVEVAQPNTGWDVEVHGKHVLVLSTSPAAVEERRRQQHNSVAKMIGLVTASLVLGSAFFATHTPFVVVPVMMATIMTGHMMTTLGTLWLAGLTAVTEDDWDEYSELLAAFFTRIDTHQLVDPTDLANALCRIQNGTNDFYELDELGPEDATVHTALMNLLTDDSFADEVVELVRVVAATDNRKTLDAARTAVLELEEERSARFAAEAVGDDEDEYKNALEAVQPDYSEEIAKLVARNRMCSG